MLPRRVFPFALTLIVALVVALARLPAVPPAAAAGQGAPAPASSGDHCVPLVFVHGIMGSAPGALDLPPFNAPDRPLFALLTENGYTEGETLFKFAYSWWQDNSLTQAQLAEFIEREVKDSIEARTGVRPQYVSIVAHSMGGLVSRLFVTTRPNIPVDTFVTVGSPYSGSAMVFTSFGSLTGHLTPLLSASAQLYPTWPAVYDTDGNIVPDNGGVGYNQWLQDNVWYAQQPDVAYYSATERTTRTVTRSWTPVWVPPSSFTIATAWYERDVIQGDSTVDRLSATTRLGATEQVPGTHTGALALLQGRGRGGIVESAAPRILQRLQASTIGGPEHCYPLRLGVTVTTPQLEIPACGAVNFTVEARHDNGFPIDTLPAGHVIEISVSGPVLATDNVIVTRDTPYQGSIGPVTGAGRVVIGARIVDSFAGKTVAQESDAATVSRAPAPTCTDACGNRLPAEWDAAMCQYHCPYEELLNRPCLPDETRSLAGLAADPSRQAASGTPIEAAHIAVLDNGFGAVLQAQLADLGIIADLLPPAFSPELASRYGVLAIPSGGLSGYGGSTLMRERLARYAANGGTLVAFTQEYGSEFALIPGGVAGYGYDEDVNCQADSAQVAAFSPIILSQPQALLSLNIDGFFTAWPDAATVVLSRRANGMPALVTYPYGAGWVAAATTYADMAAYQGQGTPAEKRLLRDLFAWAQAPTTPIDLYPPDGTAGLMLTVANPTTDSHGYLSYTLADGSGAEIMGSGAITVPLTIGQPATITTTVPISTLLAGTGSPGRWTADLALRDAAGELVAVAHGADSFATSVFRDTGAGFAVAGQPYAISVTSSSERYPYGAAAPFTFNVFNHSDRPETFEVRWILPHHSWSNIPGHSGMRTLTVPARSFATATATLDRVLSLDRLRARLFLNGRQVAYAERGIWPTTQGLRQRVTSGSSTYAWGERPLVTVTTENRSPSPLTVTSTLTLDLPDGSQHPLDRRPLVLAPGATVAYTMTLPSVTMPGGYVASAVATSGGRELGRGQGRFTLPPLAVAISPVLPAALTPGSPLVFGLRNIGGAPVVSATLALTLAAPDGAPLWRPQRALPMLSPGVLLTETLVLPDLTPHRLGNHQLQYAILVGGAQVSGGALPLPAQAAVVGVFASPTSRVRETTTFTATLTNVGRFPLAPLVTLTLPALGVTQTQAVTLPVGSATILPLTVTVPATLAAGSYPITVTLAQGGSQEVQRFALVVPPARVDGQLGASQVVAGGSLPVLLRNSGGVDTAATYSLTIGDSAGVLVATAGGSATIEAGAVATASVLLPADLVSGDYWVRLDGFAGGGAQAISLVRPVIVTGGIGAQARVVSDSPTYASGAVIRAEGVVTATAGTVSGTLALTISRAGASDFTVGTAARVNSDDETGFKTRSSPRLVVDGSGNRYAVWYEYFESNNSHILFATRPAGGLWSQSQQVSPPGCCRTRIDPDIAVDANGTVSVVFSASDGVTRLYFTRRAPGGGWSIPEEIAVGADPNLVVDDAGNAYVAWVAGFSEIYFSERATDGTWASPVHINDQSTGAQNNPVIGRDSSGRLAIAWEDSRSGNADIFVATRTITGTWLPDERAHGSSSAHQRRPALTVQGDGTLHVAWSDYRHGTSAPRIYAATRSTSGTWAPETRVDDRSGAQDYAAIAADDSSGTLTVVWRQTSNTTLFAATRAAGGAWSPSTALGTGGAVALTEDGTTPVAFWPEGSEIYSRDLAPGSWGAIERLSHPLGGGWQYDPAIGVDGGGTLYALWQDRRSNIGYDLYFATRPPAGAWGVNERVNPVTGTVTSAPSVVVTLDGANAVVWSDTRNGDPDIFFAERAPGGTWAASERVDDSASGTQGLAVLRRAPDGTLHAAWMDARGGSGYDIYYASRPPGGTWSANERVNDLPGKAVVSARGPALALASDGTLYVAWSDTRNGNRDVYAASRPPGGTWGASQRLDDATNTLTQENPTLAVGADGTLIAAWEHDSDGATTTVRFAQRPPGGSWSAATDLLSGYQRRYENPLLATAGDGSLTLLADERSSGYSGTFYRVVYRYRASDGIWAAPLWLTPWGVSPAAQRPAVALDGGGVAHVIWSAETNDGDGLNDRDIYAASVSPPAPRQTLWQRDVGVNTATTQPISETVGPLDALPGKFHLRGTMRSGRGQALATTAATFYIHPADAALTLAAPAAARPGEPVTVTGWLTNTSAAPVTLTLALTADGQPILTQPHTLAPGAGVAYSAIARRATAGMLTLAATGGSASVREVVTVAPPQVAARLTVPPLVGRDPFSATLTITNTGALTATLTADFAGQANRATTLPPGAVTALQASLTVGASGAVTVALGGDVAQTLSAPVTLGEVVGLALGHAGGSVASGPLALPITLTNSGALVASLPLALTLDGAVIYTETVATSPGTEASRLVWLDLAPGTHSLTAAIPGTVQPLDLTASDPAVPTVTLAALAGPPKLAGRAPVSITLANPGPSGASGQVVLALSAGENGKVTPAQPIAALPFDLPPGFTRTLTATLDSAAVVASGGYTLTAEAWLNGTAVTRATHPLAVPAADLHLAPPPPLTLAPGAVVSAPLAVTNVGGVGAPFTLTLDLDGLAFDTRLGWVEAGETVTVTPAISVPVDIEARSAVGHLWLNEAARPFTYTILGPALDMHADLSALLVPVGGAVTVTLQVTETSGMAGPLPLVARLAGAGEPQTATLTLAPTAQATFVLTDTGATTVLSYGLYHPDGRSLLLDTLRVVVLDGADSLAPVALVPDAPRYRPGATATIGAHAAVSGTLAWAALGVTGTLPLQPGSPAAIPLPLPADLPAGRYDLAATFHAADGRRIATGAPIEVAGDRVSLRGLTLDAVTSGCAGIVTPTLALESRTPLAGAALQWRLLAPDGQTVVATQTQRLDLAVGRQWFQLPPTGFDSSQAGTHRLAVRAIHAGRLLSAGSTALDVGDAALLGIAVPQPFYRSTTPVTVTVALLNSGGAPLSLALMVDGQPVASRSVTAAGYQVEAFDLGVLPEGAHTIAATLTGAGGCASRAAASVAVVPPATVEIGLTHPTGLNGWYVTTPTITIRPDGVGAVLRAHYRWDSGAALVAGAGPIAPPLGDGLHWLSAWAEADDGSSGHVITRTVPLDRTPPLVTASVAGQGALTVTLVATDSTSGVGWVRYALDAGSWLTYTHPITVSPAPTATLHYIAADLAGQRSITATLTLAATVCPSFDGDGRVGIADIQAVAGRWANPAAYDPRYDLDGDSAITLQDVMAVAGRWEDNCQS